MGLRWLSGSSQSLSSQSFHFGFADHMLWNFLDPRVRAWSSSPVENFTDCLEQKQFAPILVCSLETAVLPFNSARKLAFLSLGMLGTAAG
jgi:hypothetical protein